MLKLLNMVFLWYSNWSSESVSGLDKGKFGSAKNTCFGGFEQVSTLSRRDSSLSLHKHSLILPFDFFTHTKLFRYSISSLMSTLWSIFSLTSLSNSPFKGSYIVWGTHLMGSTWGISPSLSLIEISPPIHLMPLNNSGNSDSICVLKESDVTLLHCDLPCQSSLWLSLIFQSLLHPKLQYYAPPHRICILLTFPWNLNKHYKYQIVLWVCCYMHRGSHHSLLSFQRFSN